MSPVVLSLICGVGFGAVAVGLMLPMTFPNKRTALIAAFASRFAIGFLIPLVALPVPGVAKGALIGLLISLPDAIVTRAYVPILAVGVVGGAIIGFIVSNAAI
jgi:predicted neutral ceramidase superfamily lipid hydrolase